MTPYWLTVVGVILATIVSLSSALKKNRQDQKFLLFILSLPLAFFAGSSLANPEATLALSGYGSESARLLSLTLQYDQPGSGLGVVESQLRLYHPFASLLHLGFIICAALSLFTSVIHQIKNKWISKLALLSSSAWFVICVLSIFTHQATAYVVHGGESGVRSFLKWSALDPQRVSNFVLPQESWFYIPQQNELFILSAISSLLMTYIFMSRAQNHENPIAGEKEIESTLLNKVYHGGALLCLASTLWMTMVSGFNGTAQETLQWIITLSLAMSASIGMNSKSKVAISVLSLLGLSFPVL